MNTFPHANIHKWLQRNSKKLKQHTHTHPMLSLCETWELSTVKSHERFLWWKIKFPENMRARPIRLTMKMLHHSYFDLCNTKHKHCFIFFFYSARPRIIRKHFIVFLRQNYEIVNACHKCRLFSLSLHCRSSLLLALNGSMNVNTKGIFFTFNIRADYTCCQHQSSYLFWLSFSFFQMRYKRTRVTERYLQQ